MSKDYLVKKKKIVIYTTENKLLYLKFAIYRCIWIGEKEFYCS